MSNFTPNGDRASTATAVRRVIVAIPSTRLWVTVGATDARQHGRHLVGRVPGLDQEAAEGAGPLVGRAIGIGGEPPVRFQRVALEEAGGDLGVADVEVRSMGSKLRREGRLGQLDRPGPDPSHGIAGGSNEQRTVLGDPVGPACHGASNRRPRSQSRSRSAASCRLLEPVTGGIQGRSCTIT